MKKVLKLIKNIFISILLIIYLSIVILASVLLLSKNDYGITEFSQKALIPINYKNQKYNYNNTDLVIIEKVDFNNIKINDELFIYKTDANHNSVEVVPSIIKEINKEEQYVTLEDETVWGVDYIAGKSVKCYKNLGGLISFSMSKWIFFVIFIIPCFLILIYEIYLLVITVKYDDYSEEDLKSEKDDNEKIVFYSFNDQTIK